MRVERDGDGVVEPVSAAMKHSGWSFLFGGEIFCNLSVGVETIFILRQSGPLASHPPSVRSSKQGTTEDTVAPTGMICAASGP